MGFKKLKGEHQVLGIVRDLIARAARAASGGNLQSWQVYARYKMVTPQRRME